jgi:hypothetical protein
MLKLSVQAQMGQQLLNSDDTSDSASAALTESFTAV